jgi:hypothetical protein
VERKPIELELSQIVLQFIESGVVSAYLGNTKLRYSGLSSLLVHGQLQILILVLLVFDTPWSSRGGSDTLVFTPA